MSGISFWELVIIFVIGLIVLGPERLPRVANQLGTWLGQARRMTRVMRRQLEDELNFEKELSIRPPAQSRTVPAKPAPERDDTWSAAHDAGSVGTGVGDAEGPDAGTSAADAPENEDTNVPGQEESRESPADDSKA